MKKKTIAKMTSGALVAMLAMNTLGMSTPVKAAAAEPVANLQEARLSIATMEYGFGFDDVEGNKVYSYGSWHMMGGAFDAACYFYGNSSVIKDEKRGDALEIKNEKGAKEVSYLTVSPVLSGCDNKGMTISMWVKPAEAMTEHNALFEISSVDGESVLRIDGKLNSSINSNGTSCAINSDVDLELNKWSFVTLALDVNGAKMYLNGKGIGEVQQDLTACLDRSTQTCIQNSRYRKVATGVLAEDEDVQNARFDSLNFYKGRMSNTEVMTRYITSRK